MFSPFVCMGYTIIESTEPFHSPVEAILCFCIQTRSESLFCISRCQDRVFGCLNNQGNHKLPAHCIHFTSNFFHKEHHPRYGKLSAVPVNRRKAFQKMAERTWVANL